MSHSFPLLIEQLHLKYTDKHNLQFMYLFLLLIFYFQ